MKHSDLIHHTHLFLTDAESVDEQKVREQISLLREVIHFHNERYYLTADPLITDSEYDQLFARLVDREKQFPMYITPESPTQRLVGQKIDAFVTARHRAEMISLQNTYSGADISKREEGLRRIQQKQESGSWTYSVEPKLDGMSVEIVYERGKMVQAITRGDGEEGEDITEHAKLLEGLPLTISQLTHVAVVSLRGEIVLPKEAFARLSGTMTTSGTEFANARNATAGTLRQLDTNLVRQRGLTIRMYDILVGNQEVLCSTATEQFMLFTERGIPFSPRYHRFETIQEVVAYCTDEQTKQNAYESDIDLDGLVIKVHEFALRDEFGSTNHHPRWAIAYKFPAEQVATQLMEVSFQVGRTGVLTPVAHLSPIQLSGVTVSKATLHNRAFIQERDLHLGDRVIVQRSGEVIPYIVATLTDRRVGEEREIEQPKQCPVCGHEVVLDEEALTLRCTNTTCIAQRKQRLEHAVSKNCLDIGGLGPRVIELLVDAGLLTTIADITTLMKNENIPLLRRLPNIGEKKIAQITKEIMTQRPRSLWRILHALGIRHIGEVSSRDLAEGFMKSDFPHTLAGFFSYIENSETLRGLYGFGDEMVKSLEAFFHDGANRQVLISLDKEYTIDWTVHDLVNGSGPLSGKHIVVTGSFILSRELLIEQLRIYGATIQATVTSKTDLVLMGIGGGSKRTQAEQLGIPLYTLEVFCEEFDFSLPQDISHGRVASGIQQESLF